MDTGDFCGAMVSPPPPALATSIDSPDYNMCHKYRGICLILDNEEFAPSRRMPRRVGSDVDAEAITTIFTKLGFDVVHRRNLNNAGIKATLDQMSSLNHTDSDCFVCFVLTHGDHGNLYSADSRYPVNYLFNNFIGSKCPTLAGKPKLFFIQACQGSRLDSGVMVTALDNVNYYKIPSHADFLIAYSTLPGFYSFRNSEKGSWFVSSLCQVLQEYHLELDLLSMLTICSHRVAYYFTSNAASPDHCGMKQVPCITSMLTRRVFFSPKTMQI